MNGSQSPSGTMDFPMTLEEAYKEIGVTDHDISDGDVVVAFHNSHDTVKPRWVYKALGIIARHRRSQLLEFILTIIPALTKDNVRLLVATPPSSPQATERSRTFELEPGETEVISIDDDDQASKAENVNNQPAPDGLANSQLACGDPNKDSVNNSDEDMNPADDDDASPYSYSSPSSDASLLDSDCGEPIGGKYFNGNYWVCQDCNEEFSEDELEDGKCPCGHIICLCDTETFDPETDVCTCDPSSLDDNDDGSAEDEPEMAWDGTEGVWRCTECCWEVEANNENEGYCHCHLDEQDADGWRTVNGIELLNYDDYEPADSDSSGAESVDSEPDSEDEAFIEDDGPFNPEILTLIPMDES
ncbi:MAG: hypothetical protein Q9212_003082 [Teloschistes hypoglaucus]